MKGGDDDWVWIFLGEDSTPGADPMQGSGHPPPPPPPEERGLWCWPGPRKSPAMAVTGGRLYLHGGCSGYGEHYGDLYCLDQAHVDPYNEALTAAEKGTAVEAEQLPWRMIPGGTSPMCFSHTLTEIKIDPPFNPSSKPCTPSPTLIPAGSYLALVGGYPVQHHGQLHLLDLKTETWTAVPVQLPPSFLGEFVPVRHAAGVLSLTRRHQKCGPAGGSAPTPSTPHLVLVGGGAFCFSFGSLFSGQWTLDISSLTRRGGGKLLTQQQQDGNQRRSVPLAVKAQSFKPEEGGLLVPSDSAILAYSSQLLPAALTDTRAAHGTARLPSLSDDVCTPNRDSDPNPECSSEVLAEVEGQKPSWVLRLPTSLAKGAKDALKAAGWLDQGKKAEVICPSPGGAGDLQQRVVDLPLTLEAIPALKQAAEDSTSGPVPQQLPSACALSSGRNVLPDDVMEALRTGVVQVWTSRQPMYQSMYKLMTMTDLPPLPIFPAFLLSASPANFHRISPVLLPSSPTLCRWY